MNTALRKHRDPVETSTADPASRVNLGVRDLQRSVNFYALMFGFDVVAVGSDTVDRRVTMSLAGRSRLELSPRGDGAWLRQSPWQLIVDDVDQVRQNLWDYGIAVARDSGEPDQIYRLPNRSALYVRDPDGYEIEVVEFHRSTRETARPKSQIDSVSTGAA